MKGDIKKEYMEGHKAALEHKYFAGNLRGTPTLAGWIDGVIDRADNKPISLHNAVKNALEMNCDNDLLVKFINSIIVKGTFIRRPHGIVHLHKGERTTRKEIYAYQLSVLLAHINTHENDYTMSQVDRRGYSFTYTPGITPPIRFY